MGGLIGAGAIGTAVVVMAAMVVMAAVAGTEALRLAAAAVPKGTVEAVATRSAEAAAEAVVTATE